MLKFVWSYIKRYQANLLQIAICSVLIAGVDLTEPYLTAKFIDEILVVQDRAYFYTFIAFLVVISILAIASNWYSTILSSKIRVSLNNLVIEDVLKHVYKAKYDFISQTDMVYMSKRLEEDVVDLIYFAMNSIINICINSALIGFAVFLINTIAFKWVIIFVIIMVIHAYFYKILDKILFKCAVATRETGAKYFTSISDILLYIYSIKLHGLYENYINKFNDEFRKHFTAIMKQMKVRFWFSTSSTNANTVFKVLVFLLGGIDVLQGKITIGNFVALNGYFMWAMNGISYFMNVGQDYQNALAAYTRIMEIKSLPTEKNGTKVLTSIKFIELSDVSYSFSERIIFNSFTQTFERGRIYCLVGKNGSGKSTLINLICGLLHPTAGKIKYNNILIEKIDMTALRKDLISVVEQKDFLKNDNLSGGERRKLSISNALSKASDVLIMDEPDNNLDAESITVLTDKILAGKKNRIIIIISHDKRLINIADEVINFSESLQF